MTTWLFFIAYVLVGSVVAVSSIRPVWARVDAYHSSIDILGRRTHVMMHLLLRFALWPVFGPIELLGRVVDRYDPAEIRERERMQKRQLEEQERRIRSLERDLGIDR